MVERKRKIKTYGDSIGIHLTIEDLTDYELVQGSEVDISKVQKIENDKTKN